MYSEEEMLALSGIQHYSFCPRQWALIHVEQQWADNVLTVEGDLVHKRAHDQGTREKRGNLITIRGLKEKVPWGLVPHVQALLLARFIRDDLDGYPAFLWK